MAVKVAVEGMLGSRLGRDALRDMALRFRQLYVTPAWTLPSLRGLARSWPVPPPTEVLTRDDGSLSRSRRAGSGAMKRLRESVEGDVTGP